MDDASQPLEILLVAAARETRASFRDLLNMYTSGDRYTFLEAASGAEGVLHFAPKTNACVLVTDDLPDLPLEDFLARLRELAPIVPAVVIGLRQGADARERALAAGAHAYVPREGLAAKTLSHAVFDTLARVNGERARLRQLEEAAAAATEAEAAAEAESSARARFQAPALAIPVECAFDHRRLHGSVDHLTRSGARVQGLEGRPAVGAPVTLRLRLFDGAPPLDIPSHVTEHGEGNGFCVVFDSLDRRKRELLRVVASKSRKGHA